MNTNKNDCSLKEQGKRLIVFGIGIIMVVIGTRGWDFGLDYKSLLMIIFGNILLLLLIYHYEDLLEKKNINLIEKQNLNS